MSCTDSQNTQTSCTGSQPGPAAACGWLWATVDIQGKYGYRSSIPWYFLQLTLPGSWTADCISIFLFKCPFHLIASWTRLHFSDFYYCHYDSLTSHDRVLHLIMYSMEGILVCCQINEFDVSYFLHCKKCWESHPLFNISIPFMVLWVLPCSFSALSFSRLKRSGLFNFIL